MTYKNQTQSITQWAAEDRPREKMLAKGIMALSDAELLAIMIGSGSIGESAVALAQRILSSVDNNLHDLGKRNIHDLQKFKGVGQAKAITIAAALELGRRRQLSDLRFRPKISSSRDAFNAIAAILSDLVHEEFWLLLLNRANEVFARERLSIGGISGTVVDIKLVLKTALDARASGFIAIHNHPSGNLEPSRADIELTEKLKQGGRILDLPMLDHLIVSERGYFSFADEGML
ncbi:MAG: DNA repair protein RadC [Saprospiraceae bacterium]